MAAPAAATAANTASHSDDSASPSSPPSDWLQSMLRVTLPSSCTLQHLRGEAIWSLPEDGMLQSSSSADAGADASAAAAAVASPDSETDELAHQLASTSLSPAAAAVPGSPELASHPREKQHATSPPPQTPERSASAKSAPNSHAAGAAAVTPVKSGGKQGKKKHGNGDGAAPSSPSSILSPQRSAELSAHLCRVLDGSLAGLELDSEHVSSKERVAVHQLAEAQQLEHESVGYRPRRCLYIQKPYEENATDLYLVFRMDHLFLEGPSIDALGRRPCAPVDADPAWRSLRAARDGIHHHATLMHCSHVEAIRQAWPKMLEQERARVLAPWLGEPVPQQPSSDAAAAAATTETSSPRPFWSDEDTAAFAASASTAAAAATSAAAPPSEPPSPRQQLRLIQEILLRVCASRLSSSGGPAELGVGRATLGKDVAYYRVLNWPPLNALRRELGLAPVDLHVTVGFKNADVHGVRKGRHTLCAPDAEDHCSRAR